jgi:phosphopantothenoylcysteine decarboxylase/phosphopantothenate--cysteine ligase
MAAAVADWRVETVGEHKLKKGGGPPVLRLDENPDILASIAQRGNNRPSLVIGFAAETDDVVENGRQKRLRKRCDWILANDVSPGSGTFGGDRNTIHLVDADGIQHWPVMTKGEVAARLVERIAQQLGASRGV